MLKIYCSSFRERLPEEQFRRYLMMVPEAIRSGVLKFVRWQDAHTALLSKLLLQKALKDFGSAEGLDKLHYTAYGRPYLKGSSIDLNISHSGEFMLCALSNTGKVGIDIEKIRPIEMGDFESQWTAEESADMRKYKNIQHRFYYYWTRKEAVIKANGKGLSLPLNQISVISDQVAVAGQTWYLQELHIDEQYVSHLATDRREDVTTIVEELQLI